MNNDALYKSCAGTMRIKMYSEKRTFNRSLPRFYSGKEKFQQI